MGGGVSILVSQTLGPAVVLAADTRDWMSRLGWRGVLLYVVLVVVLVGGLGVIVWISRAVRGESTGPMPDHSLLAHFRDLHRRGVLKDEEYRRIKAKLTEKIRRQLDSPPEPSAPELPLPDD